MTVVISGTSRGIGKELINFFLEKGHTVIALSSNPATIKQRKNLHIINADFNEINTVLACAGEIKQHTSHIDVLINNAASLLNKAFEEITPSEFEKTYRINTEAPFFLIQQLLPLMGIKNTSHIVNISSMGGYIGSLKFPGLSVYSSSKGALSTLTECLAEELKEKNIHTNCLCLGAVNTEMLKAAFPGYTAPLNPGQMADYIGNFALTGHRYFNGKILPVSLSTP